VTELIISSYFDELMAEMLIISNFLIIHTLPERHADVSLRLLEIHVF